MAKFKKKKSEPTKGKNDEKKLEPKDNDIPEENKESVDIESKKEITKTPPTENTSKDEPLVSPEQQSDKDSKLNKLFWIRVGFAVIAGVAATFIFDSIEGEERRWASIGFMIIIFIVTIVIAKGMRIPFALSDRKKLVTQGIGSYIFIYLFMWIMSYTIVNLGNTGTSTPFP